MQGQRFHRAQAADPVDAAKAFQRLCRDEGKGIAGQGLRGIAFDHHDLLGQQHQRLVIADGTDRDVDRNGKGGHVASSGEVGALGDRNDGLQAVVEGHQPVAEPQPLALSPPGPGGDTGAGGKAGQPVIRRAGGGALALVGAVARGDGAQAGGEQTEHGSSPVARPGGSPCGLNVSMSKIWVRPREFFRRDCGDVAALFQEGAELPA